MGIGRILALNGLLLSILGTYTERTSASAPPVVVRPTQLIAPGTEPPLADAPLVVDAVAPVDPPTPTVSLRVRVAAQAAPGGEIRYRLVVNNRSAAPAHHVLVRNPLPENAVFVRAEPEPEQRGKDLIWQMGTLAPCTCREIVLILKPTGTGDVRNCARVQFEHGQCVTTRVGPLAPGAPAPQPSRPVEAPPALVARKLAPAQVLINDPVKFRIEITNAGARPLQNVKINDVLPRDFVLLQNEGPEPPLAETPPATQRTFLSWNVGTLNPGQQRVFEYQAIARKEGTFTNLAVVTAAGDIREEASARVTVGAPKVSLQLLGQSQRYVNLPASYDLVISNTSNVAINNLELTYRLPTGVTFLSASEGGALSGEKEVRWSLASLAAQTKRTLRLVVRARATTKVLHRASLTADRLEQPSLAELETEFRGATGLSASLSKTLDTVAVGQEATFMLRVQNTGTADAREVKVLARVPEQFQIKDALPVGSTIQGNEIRFGSQTVAAGTEVEYRIRATATLPGDARVRVEIAANNLTAGPLLEEASITVFKED